jgi:hypothetical protein
VQNTGATGGPRSPGAPTANAGGDQWIPLTAPGTVTTSLNGSVTNTSAVTVNWTLYSGPAAITIGNTAQAVTTATFPVPGDYTLMLSAADGIHAVAHDAAVIHVTMTPTQTRSGNDMLITFPSTSGHHYRVQNSSDLLAWNTLADNLAGTGGILTVTHTGAFGNAQQFYRVVVID